MNRKKMIQRLKKFFGTVIIYSLFIFVCVRFYTYFKNLNKTHYYTLIAEVRKTDELKEKGAVRLSGIDVGKISKLELMDNFSVKIYMNIDNGIFIPDDSSVAIYTDGLMGAKYVAILPGGSNDYMVDGNHFEYSQDSVNISEMIEIGVSQFMKDKDKEKVEGK
ncbi:MAG: MlaD family protein [Alphaproteobacteria bacterium]|nr:MlaD family protein [Alphaproteobacteria bacterium]